MQHCLNLNDKATVRLTPTGRRLWLLHYPDSPKLASDQVLCVQLWELMRAFGPAIHMGMGETPFVDNLILTEPAFKNRTKQRKMPVI